MSKLNKFQVFKAAMAMSGQGNMYDDDYGKFYAGYLVLNKMNEVGSKFSVDDGVDIRHESEEYQKEYYNWNESKES